MALYLIGYELVAPEDGYLNFMSALEGGKAQRLFSSMWLLSSDVKTSSSLKDTLAQHLGEGDRLFICEASSWAGIHLLFDPEVFCSHVGGAANDAQLVTPEAVSDDVPARPETPHHREQAVEPDAHGRRRLIELAAR